MNGPEPTVAASGVMPGAAAAASAVSPDGAAGATLGDCGTSAGAPRAVGSDEAPRHSLTVRITHWVNAASFLAFLLSGFAILLAYPRFHWGEEGALGMPSILDLPLPFVLELGIRGPGRYVHFLTAWVFVVNGFVYLASGIRTRHFRRDLIPKRRDLAWRPMIRVVLDHLRLKRSTQEELDHYNVVQRSIYLAVIFFLLPSMFVTGLAMSPMVTSVVPWLPRLFGGHQSARTLHFFAACALLAFFVVHVALVLTTGFVDRIRAMTTGRRAIAHTAGMRSSPR
jgi:thiosulfate reductase cytochrome b subunit